MLSPGRDDNNKTPPHGRGSHFWENDISLILAPGKSVPISSMASHLVPGISCTISQTICFTGARSTVSDQKKMNMLSPARTPDTNRLLALLPRSDYDRVATDLEPVHLAAGTLLAEEGQTIDHVYFLTDGIGSVVPKTPRGSRAEAGIFGKEGYIPSSAVTGTDVYTYDVRIQIRAEGYRLTYDHFRRAMEQSRVFFNIMIRAIEAFAVQLAYTAVSNAVHSVSERLARWLLMCHDRVSRDEIPLTHDFISRMLAVRRPSVTTSLHVLEGNGLIRAERGLVTIRNRAELERFASDAYGKPEREYDRLMKNVAR